MSGSTGAGEPPVTRVEVPGGQGVQVGEGATQDNTFIKNYIAQQVIQPPEAAMAGPVVAGEVPQPPPAFQPRADLMAALHESGPGVSVVRSVTGMRGVGKTQVAAAYARWCVDEGWRLVAWINAGDTAQVLNGLAVAAAQLCIGVPGAGLEEIALLVRNRLEADGDRCLVVFDNLADPDAVRPFLPAAGKSQAIITSTGLETAGLGRMVQVDVFTEQEALSFLAQRTGRSDDAGARQLADQLGFLPLALAQAAAVIAAQHLDYLTYLDRLRTAPVQDLLQRAAGEPYPRGAAEAIVLALDAVEGADPTGLCGRLINVVALLSAAGVYRALLYAAGRQGLLSHSGTETPTGPQSIDEALGRLASASLLTFSTDDATVAMHRLTMRVAVEREAQNGTLAGIGVGVAALLSAATQALPQPWRNRPAARDVVRQIMALNEHLAPYLGGQDDALAEALLRGRGWAVWCLNGLGDSFAQAIEYGQDLLADFERVLGEDDPGTVTIRSNLANAYQDAGRAGEAIPLFERTLADHERVLGQDHPDTLGSRNNLADAYQDAGRLGEAIPLFERTLADRERVLGEDHPDTLVSRNNLAAAYRDAGRLGEAILLLERTLADRERVLGQDHPNTLVSRNNLADVYRDAGRAGEAIPLFERTLADFERVLGEDHPNTWTIRNNLAAAYRAAGRAGEAIPILERTLADRERVLGEDHPDTLGCRNNLAAAYLAAGRAGEAIPILERTLADFERVLGKDHPNTLTIRSNLAAAYRAVDE
jgi:tetratricopeptide (TPR) repeat protein